MLFKITKHASKPHIILYERNDSTVTWMKATEYFVRHDLSHYVIEKNLHYTTAFMGMLNNGMDVQDFENREKRLRLSITREACYAENMANLFLMETSQGEFEDFNKMLADAFTDMKLSFDIPVLTDAEINAVRNYLKELLAQWEALPAEETMILTFDI